VSCGIDHGACLVEDESHVYGTPVIRASKLGEDVGRAGQILITKKAMQLVPDALDLELEKLTTRIAGVDVDVFSILPG
jgi:class 3 adenylate cyclase